MEREFCFPSPLLHTPQRLLLFLPQCTSKFILAFSPDKPTNKDQWAYYIVGRFCFFLSASYSCSRFYIFKILLFLFFFHNLVKLEQFYSSGTIYSFGITLFFILLENFFEPFKPLEPLEPFEPSEPFKPSEPFQPLEPFQLWNS